MRPPYRFTALPVPRVAGLEATFQRAQYCKGESAALLVGGKEANLAPAFSSSLFYYFFSSFLAQSVKKHGLSLSKLVSFFVGGYTYVPSLTITSMSS